MNARQSADVITPEQVESLEARTLKATSRLLTNSVALARIHSALERKAHSAGFMVEFEIHPPLAAPWGLKELTLHRSHFHLEDRHESADSAFPRFMQWLDETSSLDGNVEVIGVSLQSLGDGIARADVAMQVLSTVSNESAPSK